MFGQCHAHDPESSRGPTASGNMQSFMTSLKCPAPRSLMPADSKTASTRRVPGAAGSPIDALAASTCGVSSPPGSMPS
jgi:hypothetical protein